MCSILSEMLISIYSWQTKCDMDVWVKVDSSRFLLYIALPLIFIAIYCESPSVGLV